MILKPHIEDIKLIGYYLGKVIIALGVVMLLPLGLAFVFAEQGPALDFAVGALIAFIFGLLLIQICYTERDLNWLQGMIVASSAFLAAMLLGAIPLYLSGHYKSYLDACFETMSGLTTTGLTLVQDQDHLSYGHNLWRHLGPFIGGQGIIIVALSFFMKGTSGALKMYVGEAREEKLLPNVISTARFIWLISLVYLILGTLSLGAVALSIGMAPINAFFHAACIFMAGFDTAGFAPQSQNILYYHSLLFEIVVIVIMIMGALNFNLHYQLWTGNRKEWFKNIESRVFLLSVMLALFIAAIGFSQLNVYPQAITLFRKGFFQIISGHTTTGYMTVYARQFITEWGHLALVALIGAMALGGCICSTAGGIKTLRVGIVFKALVQDIKRIMLPENTVEVQKVHHIKELILEDKQVRSAALIFICYLLLYVLGAMIGMFYRYPFLNSLFESVSAAGNVGLSCGITDAAMPTALKITYILQMWAGRLEFVSVFAIIGFIVAAVKGK